MAEAANLRSRVDKCTIRLSKCAESYIEYYNLHSEYDAFLVASEPSNPWISDSTELWEMFERCDKMQMAERRVRRWAFSCWDLLKDPVGHDHFRAFLEKEYATENLLFVEDVWRMKKMAERDVAAECKRIWKQFLAPGAEMLVNVDSKTRRVSEENMRKPDRWTFDDAAAALFYLMTSDSYSRYLRSAHYKDFLEGAKRKTTKTSFGLPKLSSAKLNLVNSA
jgi:regulator of G-protein signaling